MAQSILRRTIRREHFALGNQIQVNLLAREYRVLGVGGTGLLYHKAEDTTVVLQQATTLKTQQQATSERKSAAAVREKTEIKRTSTFKKGSTSRTESQSVD